MKTSFNKTVCFLLLQISFVVGSYAQIGTPFAPRLINGNTSIKVKGDVLMIGNTIVNRANPNNPSQANIANNDTSNNNSQNSEYVDIDTDASTYSSSAASLTINRPCARIIYAGLYWTALYPNDRSTSSNGSYTGTPRSEDWNTMKFKIPGGNYIDIVADNDPDPNNDLDANPDDDDDAIIFNGYNYTNINNSFRDAPYVCYKNVTSMFQNGTTDGLYYGANVRATRGRRNGGCSGGWMLVVIYEELTLPSKFISTFDGYASVSGTNANSNLQYTVSGFESLPAPFPVRAKIGVGALEGDRSIFRDECLVKGLTSSAPLPYSINDALNPGPPLTSNFFNSTVSNLGVNVPRIPNSLNTLGMDIDMVNINNAGNINIANGETSAQITLQTNGDAFGAFFSLFAVDNIAPEIPLIKTVVDFNDDTNDITGDELGLNQEFFYKLCFRNRGNDDAISFTITDQLPTNIIFPSSGTIQPNDVLLDGLPIPTSYYTFDAATNTFVFNIPNSLVEELDPQVCIKIKVRTPRDCNDVVDACATIVTNQAFVYYTDETGTQVFTDLPSFNGVDNCQFPTPGATNTLTDIDLCTFEREEALCGNSVILTAASGYTSYEWTYDHDNNPGTAPIPFPGGTTQSITVSTVGTYFVNLITPAPCISLTETINVVYFNDLDNLTNPVIPFADVNAICPNNGEILPKIILCGANDTQQILTGINSATNIVWQRLVVGSCPGVVVTDCANTNPSCTWTQVATGPNYVADTAGQYKIIVFYQNGCFRTFYFNVFKNLLNPTITSTDIICNTPGTITITNVPLGYEFSQSPNGPWQTQNVFGGITVGSSYDIYIRQTGVDGACVFPYLSIPVIRRSFSVDVIETNQTCANGFGRIQVQVNGVNPQYYYQLLQGVTVVGSTGPLASNNHFFNNLLPGNYTVNVTTDDGCMYTENVVINVVQPLSVIATATSSSCLFALDEDGNPTIPILGTITLTGSGGTIGTIGNSSYNYAIQSIGGVIQNPLLYQNSPIFNIPVGGQGTYVFSIVDDNNCSQLSNQVTIVAEPPLVFTTNITNISCNGFNNGSVAINTTATLGYTLTYSSNGIDFQASNTFSNLAPNTPYTFTIRATRGTVECLYTVTATLTEPQPLIGQSNLVQQKTCILNGSISAINVSGGSTPYTYSINGTTFQSGNQFNDLNAGIYTITIKDNNGCVFPTQPIQIFPALAPTDLNIINTPLTCPTLVTTISATVVGGTAPFVFQIIAPSSINATTTLGTTATFAGLSAGTYTIRVTDSKSCRYEESVTIMPVVPIAVNGNVTSNVQCFGSATGSALFNVSGFNTTYSYTVNNGTPITNQTATTINLTNLNAGVYSVVVTDNQTNCQATRVVTVNQPAVALQLAAPFSPITCNGSGSLNASATGGWGSFEYTLILPNNTSITQTNGIFGNLSQTGVYTISVSDANNCVVSTNFTMSAPPTPVISILPTSNLCISATTGAAINVTTTGGTTPYQYQLNNGALQNSGIFTNLQAGTYIIKVIDAFGCESTLTQVIHPRLTASASLTKDLDCTTNPNALINVTIVGGLAPYQSQIRINNGTFGALTNVNGSSISFPTSNPGTYQFQITDAQGCTFLTNVITVNPIVNPSITSITPVQPNCFGESNGSLTVNINTSLGQSPFEYSLNNGTFQTLNSFQNLTAGTYTIVVKDAKDCIATQTIVLGQPAVLAGQSNLVQQISCNNTTGTISAISVSGGTTPYEYAISGTFVTNPEFSLLSDGTYTITIKDAKGCTVVTNPITIATPSPPTDITLSASAITCPSLTTTITATAIGGIAPYTYQIISPSVINSTTQTGNTATFSNLNASSTQTYTVRVTDANGCFYQKNITIQALPTINVSGNVNNNITCFGAANGSATFTVTGSTNFSYSLNNGTVVTNQTNPIISFPNLSAGIYSLIITDSVTNCTSTASITINSPTTVLALTPNITQPTCTLLGSINAVASGGWGSYQYILTTPSGTIITQNSGVFNNLADNIVAYTITVRDANGCEVTQNFTLVPYVGPTVSIDPIASDLCYDATNAASISVNAVGGTPNYQYQIREGAGTFGALVSTPLFSNLTPSTYTIRVTDVFGCFAEITQVIAPQIIATATITKNLDCTASPNATISLNVSGGVAPYQYQVKFNTNPYSTIASLPSNPFAFTTANAGNYQFQITDALGCIMVSNVITILPISNPAILSLTQLGTILCNGNTTAGIQVIPDPTLGQSPFMYSLNSGAFQNETIFPNLGAGNYTITIRDANMCTNTASITIAQPNALSFITSNTDLLCSGDPLIGNVPGTITISGVSGGTLPLTYNIRNLTFDLIDTFAPITTESHTFTNVDFGVYIVEIVDGNGCTISNNVTIASPPSSLVVANATANCATGATVEVTVLAFVPGNNYEFGILNTANSPYVIAPNVYQPSDVPGGSIATFTNLIPGLSYTFVVRDINTNCYYIQDVPTQIVPSSSVTFDALVSQNVSCTGSSNGTVSFTINNFDAATTSVTYTIYESITNAATPYTATLPVTGATTPITVNSIGLLDFGSYYILIEEDGGCTTTSPIFTILESTQQLIVSAQVVNSPNCNPNSGTIIANAQFGTPPYQYLVQLDTEPMPTAGTTFGGSSLNTLTQDVNGNQIVAGNYIVYAQDANFCMVQTPIIPVNAIVNPAISLVIDTPCANEGEFAIEVTRAPGSIVPYTYSINNGLAFTEVSNPFIIPNLTSGVYNIKVTDGNGCFTDQNITITPRALIAAQIITQPSCTAGAEVTVTATGGTGPFVYSIQNNAGITLLTNGTGLFNDPLLTPGNYTATIVDQNLNGTNTNCTSTTNFSLETPTPVDFSVLSQNPTCDTFTDGVIEVTLNPLNNNNPPYTYTLSATGFTTVTQIGNNVFTGLGDNNYTVTVTSNRNCIDTEIVPLTEPNPLVANDPNLYTFTCTNSGIITLNGLTVTGGDSTYFYSLDNSNFQPLTNPSNIILTDNGLQQNITVFIRDGEGCTTQFVYAPFEPLVSINNPIVNVITQLNCIGGEEINVTFNANPTSSGNYTYQLFPFLSGDVATPFTDTSATPSFSPPLLTATGDYTYEIIDLSTGCKLYITHTVVAFPVATSTVALVQPIDCFNVAIGQFSFTVENYTGNYSYEIFSSPSNTSIVTGSSNLISTAILSPNNLAAGNYYVVITQTAYPRCILTSPIVTITSPFEALDLDLVATNDRNCLTDSGTILATASGGTPPYLYQLSNGSGIIEAFSTNNYFENLTNGSYIVELTDAKSCPISQNILVDIDPTPTIGIALNDACVNEGSFEIEITRITDGIAPYTYTVNTNAPITQNTTPFIIPNLVSGTYNITIADANGCGETQSITIVPVLNGEITNIVQPSCDVNDGIIDANALSGSGSFTFTLENSSNVIVGGPNNDGLFTGLGHDAYTVIIIDNDPLTACEKRLIVTLEEPTAVNYTFDVIQPTCNVLNGGIANGSITVNLDASNNNGPYTYELSDGVNPVISQNSPLFTGLEGSDTGITYTLTVTSNRGCDKVETIVLQNPTPIVIPTITVDPFECNSSNGVDVVTISIPNPTGGTAPYLYSFDGINFGQSQTNDFVDTGLVQTITVTVKDSNSCEALQTITINPIIKVDASVAQVSPLTCDTDEMVQITINGDPSHSYTYQLLPSIVPISVVSTTFTTTLSQPGTYNFLITDTTTNCTVITDDYTISPLNVFDVTATPLTNVTCFNGNNGTMEFVITDYLGNFSYDVLDVFNAVFASSNDVVTGANNVFSVSNLESGNYTIRVSIPTSNSYQDCTVISNVFTIGTPQEILLTVAQTSPVTCTNDQGTIVITSTSGGTGVYEYQLISLPSGTVVYPFNSSYASTGFTGLGFGDYQVIVRDANNCEAQENITLIQSLTITADFAITNQNLNCFGDTNASVAITNVINGSGEYQYLLTYPNGATAGPQPNPLFTNLGGGNGYFITIIDGWNCDIQLANFDINEPAQIQASLLLETAITCETIPQVRITASGGTAPYFVNGQSFNSSIVINAVMPFSGSGVFQYTVTDSNNCAPATTNEIIINPIAPIDVELLETVINVNCANDDNALIIVTNTTGGLGDYVYQLQDASGTNIGASNTNGIFFNIAGSLIPGETYFVAVTSDGGCNGISPAILVTEPIPLTVPTINVTNVRCAGDTNGAISVTLAGGVKPYQFAVSPNPSQAIDTENNADTINLTGLGAGTYTVYYQDVNGCASEITRTVTAPSALTFFNPTVLQPACDGESGSVTLEVTGGTPGPNGYEFSFNSDSNYATNGTNIYTNTTSVFGDQEYEIYVRDANGCVTNATFQTNPTVDLSSTFIINPGCPTLANPTANELVVFIDNSLLATTEFSLDNQTDWQASNVFTNISPEPATHIVYIRNANGCIKQTDVITADFIEILGLTVVETPEGLNELTAQATGGVEDYTYIFNGVDNGTDNTFIFSETGLQTVTVIDANNCEETVQIPATFYDIEIPNYFTPNEGWTPTNISNFKDLITKVFDRYGREIIILRNGQRWDGTYNGNDLPSGDYWYLVEVNDGTGRTFVGNVTLYR